MNTAAAFTARDFLLQQLEQVGDLHPQENEDKACRQGGGDAEVRAWRDTDTGGGSEVRTESSYTGTEDDKVDSLIE